MSICVAAGLLWGSRGHGVALGNQDPGDRIGSAGAVELVLRYEMDVWEREGNGRASFTPQASRKKRWETRKEECEMTWELLAVKK